jgi:hypothetical protein
VEASYVYVTAAHGGAESSASPLAYLWREYGRADRRWALYDPTVLALELLTVAVGGPLAAACAFGVYARRPWRHLAVVVLCVAELYGGWMTFAPEWLAGSPALSGDPYLQVRGGRTPEAALVQWQRRTTPPSSRVPLAPPGRLSLLPQRAVGADPARAAVRQVR